MTQKRPRSMTSNQSLTEQPVKIQKLDKNEVEGDQEIIQKYNDNFTSISSQIEKALSQLEKPCQILGTNITEIQKLMSQFVNHDIKKLPQYQVIRDNFMNFGIEAIENQIPAPVREFLLEKHSRHLLKGGTDPNNLGIIWDNTWDQMSNLMKIATYILSANHNDNDSFIKYIDCVENQIAGTAKEIYKLFPFGLKAYVLKNLFDEFRQTQETLRDLHQIKQAIDSEGNQLQESIKFITETSYAKNIELNSLKDLEISYNKEKNRVENEIQENEKALENFKGILALAKSDQNEEVSSICSICLSEGRTHSLPCGHIFCLDCINNVRGGYSGRKKCPDCRSEYNQGDVRRVFI